MSGLMVRLKQVRLWGIHGTWRYFRRMVHENAVRKFLLGNAASCVGTVPQRGLTIVAHMSGSYSLSKAMRDFVICLRKSGIPHQVLDCGKPDANLDRSAYEYLLTPRNNFNILKFTHIVEMVNSPLPSGLPLKRCRIIFWEGENGLLQVYPYLIDSDVVIAMSDYNARYFRETLPERVAVAKVVYPLMPIPEIRKSCAETRQCHGIGQNDFTFLYNFDLLAFSRKNPDGLMRAFAKGFHGVENAKLVLKTNHARDFSAQLVSLEMLATELDIERQVVFLNDYLSSVDMYALTAACDAYVSLHRGEGFGLGIAEAMQLGKPVVVTAYSAPLEFCNDETALLVPFTRRQLDDRSIASQMGSCADADLDAAAKAMRRLYDDRPFAEALGNRARHFMERHFSNKAFRTSIEALLRVRGNCQINDLTKRTVFHI